MGMIDGPNVYAYVGNNPVNFIDPNGMWMVEAEWAMKKVHYDLRSHLNRNVPQTQAGAMTKFYQEAKPEDNAFHAPATKMIGPNGRMEGAYLNGVLTNDQNIMGTYNFAPASDALGHTALDIVPWIMFGNGPEDSSNSISRLVQAGQGLVNKMKSSCGK